MRLWFSFSLGTSRRRFLRSVTRADGMPLVEAQALAVDTSQGAVPVALYRQV